MKGRISELIPKIKKVKLELPLIQWAYSVNVDVNIQKELVNLLRVYRLTNDCYDQRFKEDKVKDLSEYLKQIDKYGNPYKNQTCLAMKNIVKANLLLRRGQVKADSFLNPTDDYQQACVILAQYKNQEEEKLDDFLKFLVDLNLGKYFRNMGMFSHKSDNYRRALDEFTDLLERLTNSDSLKEMKPWKYYIWLEAAMNLSRIELYLYRFKEAKIHLWKIYQKTKELNKSSNIVESIFIEDKGSKEEKEVKEVNDFIQSNKIGKVLCEPRNNDKNHIDNILYKDYSEIRENYSVQALIQMGIAFRKTCDYTTARRIFAGILANYCNNNWNVDALNNYAVCLRKSGFSIDDPSKEEQDFFLKELKEVEWSAVNIEKLYLAIINSIIRGKDPKESIPQRYKNDKIEEDGEKINFRNRFAAIEYIRALLNRINEHDCNVDQIGLILDQLLKNNPRDRELLLQKGIFLQKSGKIAESQKIFNDLFLEDKRIAKGTIGLKAYYCMGCNFLAEKRFYEAKNYFSKIRDAFSRTPKKQDDSSRTSKVVCLNDLPNIDVLSEMDYAWCLMSIGEYKNAEEIFLNILTNYSSEITRLGLYNEMKIRNNLIECCLQLLAGYFRHNQEREKIENYKSCIVQNIESISEKEQYNATAFRHYGYYNLLCGKYASSDDQKVQLFKKALDFFEKAALGLHGDVYTHSGWVSAVYELYGIEKQKCEAFNLVTKRLHYISGPYAIRSCAKLSEILYSFIQDNRIITEDECKVLLRCMARIHMSEGEEGYTLFQELKENDVFFALDSVDRGKLLIILFQIYKNILDIKERCRYYPDSNNLPVQYRSIKRLKNYLEGEKDQSGRFSLWNIAYMNDYFEGESFNKILSKVADKDYKEIAEYYINSKEDDNGGNLISSAEKNIYISSLSLKKDVIPMWIAYADTGKGCAVTYSEEFLRLVHRRDLVTDVACYSDADYPLYKVCYIETNDKQGAEEADNTLKEINSSIRTILHLLSILESNLNDMDYPDEKEEKTKLKNVIDEFVRSCFNEVRFLIKDSEYASEEEIRMIHYSKEGKLSVEEDKIPRFYIEREGEVLIEEVILGPKIDTFQQNEISTWLYKTGKVKKVKRSNRHYR